MLLFSKYSPKLWNHLIPKYFHHSLRTCIVFIYTSLMTTVKPLFMYLLTIYIPTLEKYSHLLPF